MEGTKMIDAKEAKSISNTINLPVIAPFQKELEKLIREKAIDGSYRCEIAVPDTLKNVIIGICRELTELGYNAVLVFDNDGKIDSLVVKW
jgi:hypothetical protein